MRDHPSGGVPHGKNVTIRDTGKNSEHVNMTDPRIAITSVPPKPGPGPGSKPLSLVEGERGTSRG